MDYVVSMFVNRPYVVTLVFTFLLVAAAERGWLPNGTTSVRTERGYRLVGRHRRC